MKPRGLACIRNLIFGFNLILVLTVLGIILAAVVIYIIYSDDEFWYHIDGEPFNFVLFNGIVVFVPAIFGCYGAMRKSYCMLMTYSVVLFVMFVGTLYLGVEGLTRMKSPSQLVDEIRTDYFPDDNTILYYGENKRKWDTVHDKYECCGVDGPADWRDRIPASCCQQSFSNISHFNCAESDDIFKDGCRKALEKHIWHLYFVFIGLFLGNATIELAGSVLAWILAKNLKKLAKVDIKAVEAPAIYPVNKTH